MRAWQLVLLLFVGCALLGASALRYLEQQWHTPVAVAGGDRLYDVAPGTTTRQMLDDLQALGYWQQPEPILLGQRLFMPGFVLKAGEYQLPSEASPDELLALFNAGQSVQYRLVFTEGEAARQWQQRLADTFAAQDDSLEGQGEQWLRDALSATAQAMMRNAGVTEPAVEGWFFPDTYYYDRQSEPADILGRAHRKMLAVLKREWSGRAAGLPYEHPYEALVMASLIEKETGVATERAQIAGVFVRRLQQGMRLQTDPTVIYGMGERYTGNLRRADLQADNPYNTYRRDGLPPTPIAMPGADAIHAALHPAEGTALYFVARGDGTHHFSDTFAEHQAAVRKYQILNRRSDYRSSPPTTAPGGQG